MLSPPPNPVAVKHSKQVFKHLLPKQSFLPCIPMKTFGDASRHGCYPVSKQS